MTTLTIIAPTIGGKKARRWFKKEFTPNYASLILAGETPDGIDVKIKHESIDDIDYDNDTTDLIAIPIPFSSTAPRAYEIADEYRKRGKTVVLGGVHVWAMPDEAEQHADSIVVGEAEGIWKGVIKDFQKGNLQKRYDAPTLDEWRISPKRELLDKKRYLTVNVVQTSRGCPHDCMFCSVTSYQGRKMRHRPVEDVLKEITSLDGRIVLFLDDNIFGDIKYTKELLTALIPYKKRWFGQATNYIADNGELMGLARESGCGGLFLGFESISEDSLQEANKGWNNPAMFAKRIEKLHSYGIDVIGSFVFGFDTDDISVFDRTVDFALENRIELANFAILTPLPGTRLFKRLEEEGRLISTDWSKYDAAHVVFQPKQMSPQELQQGFYRAYERVYTLGSVVSAIRDPEFLLPIRFAFWKAYMAINKMQRRIDDAVQDIHLDSFLERCRTRAESVQCYLADKKEGMHEFIAHGKEGIVERMAVPYKKLRVPYKQATEFKAALAERIRLISGTSVSYDVQV